MSEPPGDVGAPRRVIVRSATAPLHAEASTTATQISEALAGHVLDVLDREDDWLLVRGTDGYEGWAHRGYVAPAEGGGGGAPDGRRLSLDCVVESPGVAWRRRLPLGALLDPGDVVREGEAVGPEERRRRFPRRPDAVARTAAERFQGTSYEWGGITPWGADCSGLVQTAFGLHGVPLPRDAWQQALEGELRPADVEALRPADLLFFADAEGARVTHVAVALGDARVVHLSLARGGYAVEDLRDGRDPVVATLLARFRFARRMGFRAPASSPSPASPPSAAPRRGPGG